MKKINDELLDLYSPWAEDAKSLPAWSRLYVREKFEEGVSAPEIEQALLERGLTDREAKSLIERHFALQFYLTNRKNQEKDQEERRSYLYVAWAVIFAMCFFGPRRGETLMPFPLIVCPFLMLFAWVLFKLYWQDSVRTIVSPTSSVVSESEPPATNSKEHITSCPPKSSVPTSTAISESPRIRS